MTIRTGVQRDIVETIELIKLLFTLEIKLQYKLQSDDVRTGANSPSPVESSSITRLLPEEHPNVISVFFYFFFLKN